MQAFAIENFGETGSVRELPDPKPEAGEVLVRVQTAGVNVVDGWVLHGALKDMMEHRFPLIPGVEAAGVVESIGSDVGDFAEGDRVNGVSLKPFFGSGTFAELATLPPKGWQRFLRPWTGQMPRRCPIPGLPRLPPWMPSDNPWRARRSSSWDRPAASAVI